MKDIRFRIWDKRGAWLCEDSQYLIMDGSKVIGAPWSTLSFELPSEDYIIQQFTGIYDKNKNPIYEGDIIRYTEKMDAHGDAQSLIAAVFFDDEIGAFAAGRNDDFWNLFSDMTILRNTIEVIGNIFENGDLLT